MFMFNYVRSLIQRKEYTHVPCREAWFWLFNNTYVHTNISNVDLSHKTTMNYMSIIIIYVNHLYQQDIFGHNFQEAHQVLNSLTYIE